MIDLSSLKAPGWQRIVAELNAPAPDDRVYYERLLRVMAQVSAARQAVLYVPDKMDGEEVDPRVEMVWPPAELDKDAEQAAQAAAPASNQTPVQFGNEARTAARAAFAGGQARAFGLDKQEQYYGEGASSGFVLAIPMRAGPGMQNRTSGGQEVPAAVATLLVEQRSKDAVRSTLAMAEVLAGYVSGHYSRAALRKTQAASFSLDLATRLIASVNTASNFRGACMQLCNDLAKQFAVDRVALGWVTNDIVKVKAISDVEHFDPRMQMVQKMAAAMDECLDQEQPVLFPPPPESGEQSDVLLSQAITHAHRELAAGNQKLKVCSLPLREADVGEGAEEGGGIIGVVTIESAGDGPVELATIELLQAAMDLIAPLLKVRRNDDRNLALRAWDSTKRAGAWVVGSKHTVWKLVGVLAVCVFAFVCLYQTTYRPGAEATLEPRVRRIVSAPFDGVINLVPEGVEPGRPVSKGDVLVQLDTSELVLGMANAMSKVESARTQASYNRKLRSPEAPGKVAAAEQQEEQAQAEVNMYLEHIKKSTIIAPISGTVIAGEMKDRIGSTIKTGDLMFQIAPMDDIIVTAKVDERDIALIKRSYEEGLRNGFKNGKGMGEVQTKAKPDEPFPFQIERIVPLATPVEGKNVFEVRCKLIGRPEWFRPGVEGIAKFNTETKPLIWIGTRRLLDQIRLWLWW